MNRLATFVLLIIVVASVSYGSLSKLRKLVAASSLTFGTLLSPVYASDKPIVVLGGSGFVGSRVVRDIAQNGRPVISISRSGKAPAWAKNEKFMDSVKWIKGDIGSSDLSYNDADAVVSCVGVIGLDNKPEYKKVNGDDNANAVLTAKSNGVSRFVYVGVSDEVPKVMTLDSFQNYCLSSFFLQ